MARKQTSSRVSSIAGQWLRLLRGVRGSRDVGHYARGAFGGMIGWLGTVAELRSVLGSALAQDETRGQVKPNGRKKRKVARR